MRHTVPVASFAMIVLALSACAPTMNFSPAFRRQAAQTPILSPEQLTGRPYTIITEISSRSCARQAGSDPSIEAAREGLKIKAAEQNANAVANVLCKEGGVSVVHNCWRSVECRGDAIRWNS